MENKVSEEMLLLVALTKQVLDDHDMMVRQNKKLKEISALLSGSQESGD